MRMKREGSISSVQSRRLIEPSEVGKVRSSVLWAKDRIYIVITDIRLWDVS